MLDPVVLTPQTVRARPRATRMRSSRPAAGRASHAVGVGSTGAGLPPHSRAQSRPPQRAQQAPLLAMADEEEVEAPVAPVEVEEDVTDLPGSGASAGGSAPGVLKRSSTDVPSMAGPNPGVGGPPEFSGRKRTLGV